MGGQKEGHMYKSMSKQYSMMHVPQEKLVSTTNVIVANITIIFGYTMTNTLNQSLNPRTLSW